MDVPNHIRRDQICRVSEMGDEVEVRGVARKCHLNDIQDPEYEW